MSDIKQQMKNYFEGDRELAKAMLSEVNIIKQSVDRLEKLLSEELEYDKRQRMFKVLAKSYAEISSEIEIPIYFKFNDLKNGTV